MGEPVRIFDMAKTKHPRFFVDTINTYDDRVVVAALEKLGREAELRQFLNEFLPEA